MYPTEFPGVNVIFGAGQEDYQPLPALKLPDGEVITFWQFNEEELEKMIANKGFYLKQLTFNQALQPILPMADLGDDVNVTLG